MAFNLIRAATVAEPQLAKATSADSPRGRVTWRISSCARYAGAGHGIHHGTSSGSTTWHGLAAEAFAGLGLGRARVEPTTTEAFPRPAHRPAYSLLAHDSLVAAGVTPIRNGREALREALPTVAPQ